ncbi:hypothetical protein PPERSA_03939 [Pseudocohnilembus persalinus]|uniref:DnaJ domain n=1 Tax=Pseudocohnilembus persalinus TaxID=266149 RepID=A0A0V0R6M8_PSEPJ|nr:hypothetical protein PPERSA_03939 [Pseudocohnilembus persalinus]|eukprot:KRX09877.1 hypothetical protein PPERSA_03939 [Pseudocohnilembus persalinus]
MKSKRIRSRSESEEEEQDQVCKINRNNINLCEEQFFTKLINLMKQGYQQNNQHENKKKITKQIQKNKEYILKQEEDEDQENLKDCLENFNQDKNKQTKSLKKIFTSINSSNNQKGSQNIEVKEEELENQCQKPQEQQEEKKEDQIIKKEEENDEYLQNDQLQQQQEEENLAKDEFKQENGHEDQFYQLQDSGLVLNQRDIETQNHRKYLVHNSLQEHQDMDNLFEQLLNATKNGNNQNQQNQSKNIDQRLDNNEEFIQKFVEDEENGVESEDELEFRRNVGQENLQNQNKNLNKLKKKKLLIQNLRQYIQEREGKLVTPLNTLVQNDINAFTVFSLQCQQNHIWDTSLKILANFWCPRCQEKFQHVQNYVKRLGGKVLSKCLLNIMDFECSRGHIFQLTLKEYADNWCQQCYQDILNNFDMGDEENDYAQAIKESSKKQAEDFIKKNGTLFSLQNDLEKFACAIYIYEVPDSIYYNFLKSLSKEDLKKHRSRMHKNIHPDLNRHPYARQAFLKFQEIIEKFI